MEHAKGKIHELNSMLPDTPNPNFRERLAAQLEASEHLLEAAQDRLEFRQKAGGLLALYSNVFGVNDVVVILPDSPIA